MLNKPIIITGCARSGTSMTAGVIHLSGAWCGETQGPGPHNKKGMYENIAIRNSLIKPYLYSMGCDPRGQDPLPDIDDCKLVSGEMVQNWKESVIATIMSQGYGGGPWFVKEVKICLQWPVWARAFPEARWIIVRRRTADIIHSCLRTTFMTAYTTRAGWCEWIDHHKEQFIEMEHAGLDIQYVWPQRMIDRDFTEIKRVIARLGLKYDQDAIEDFIEPALWSAR